MNTKLNYRIVADISLVLVAIIWGAGIPMSAALARGISPLWAIALRMALAGLALFLLFPRRVFNGGGQTWFRALCLSILLSLIFILMTFALKYSTASKQAFIIGITVILVPFLVWGLHRTPPQKAVFYGATLAALGLLIMGFTPQMRFNTGDLLSGIMVIANAGQILLIGYYARQTDIRTLVSQQIILTGLILTFIALIFEPIPSFNSFSAALWGQIIIVALANTVLCFLMQYWAQRHTSESHTAIILSLESLFGYLVALLMGQDPFHFQGLAGGLMILAGVLIAEADIIKKTG